jgi:high affinity sulfate transporter 1
LEPSALERHIPISRWLPSYPTTTIGADLLGGFTLWGMAVPAGIAYAGLAGMPPEAGLYTLLGSLAAAAVLSSSRHLVIAATSASAAMAASAIAGLAPPDAATSAALFATLVLAVGGVFLLAGVAKLGFVTQFLSRPVMEGFVFGLAIFVIVKQLPKLVGVSGGDGDSVQELVSLLSRIGEWNPLTTVIGVGGIVLLLVTPRISARLPSGLILLAIGIGLSTVADLADRGVAVVGSIPTGLPTPHLPDLQPDAALTLVAAAAGIALVAFSESLGAADAFATKHRYDIDPDQELVALGAANLASGVFGGLVAGGSMSQSAVSEGAGARTQLSNLVAVGLVLVTVVALMPLFTNLPTALLASLIIVAVSGLMKVPEMRQYYELSRTEFALGMVALLGVILIDVLPGMVIAVVLCVLVVAYRSSRPRVSSLGREPGVRGDFRDIERHPEARPIDGLVIVRPTLPIYYGNARAVRDRIREFVRDSDPPARAVVLDLDGNDGLDLTSAEMLTQEVEALRASDVDVMIATAHAPLLTMARRTGLLDRIGEANVFPTIGAAVTAFESGDRR